MNLPAEGQKQMRRGPLFLFKCFSSSLKYLNKDKMVHKYHFYLELLRIT